MKRKIQKVSHEHEKQQLTQSENLSPLIWIIALADAKNHTM